MFLYFVPNATKDIPGVVADIGLSYAFEGVTPHSREILANGPAGQAGAVVSAKQTGLGYFKDTQIWIPHDSAKFEDNAVWIGKVINESMEPADLLRSHTLEGREIELQDGNQWHVPLIRAWCDDDEENDLPAGYAELLPRSMGVDQEALAAGEYKLTWNAISEQFKFLLDVAAEYYDWFSRDDDSKRNHSLDNPEAMTRLAVKVLAVNYRVSLAEATLLDLFDSRTAFAQSILNYAALDWDNLSQWLKKKRMKHQAGEDGLNTTVGDKTGHFQSTNQPTLTT